MGTRGEKKEGSAKRNVENYCREGKEIEGIQHLEWGCNYCSR